ncbi:MAG TPA: C4-type zinc ribbon domain-containing protein [Anaerolineales bacterium]
MSAALGLYRLQQVDSQIDHIQSRLKAIHQLLENDAELRAANNQSETAENQLKEAERLLKQTEQEVEKQRIKLQQTESSLYGGLVHNPKELQDLQKDVVSLKRHLETLEERELEAMVVVETAEKDVQNAKASLARVVADRGDQFRGLTAESETLHKDLERFTSERNAVITDLATKAIQDYEQLRKQRRGIAVTTISEGSCASCGTILTQSLQQSARSASQLFYCPTCGRILFAN